MDSFHYEVGSFLGIKGYKRFVFYFVNNETRIKKDLILPQFDTPGVVNDMHIEYCGKKVKGGVSVDRWIAKNKPPKRVLERLHKSEKAVDTQICCDALQLAASGKLDRLILYANDYDFIPLCKIIKTMGANISLIRLEGKNVNKDLVKECDSFSVVPNKNLNAVFA
jgi:uncharacterized LabA/DUF88 family protein